METKVVKTDSYGWYYAGMFLVGGVTFLGIWIYSFTVWGLLFGLLFGWLPALIGGILAGLLWPIIALIVILFLCVIFYNS